MQYELLVGGHRCRIRKHVARRCWDVEAQGRFGIATLHLTRGGKVWAIDGDYDLGRQVAEAAQRAGIVG